MLLERLIAAQKAQENMHLVDERRRVYCGTCGKPGLRKDMKNHHLKGECNEMKEQTLLTRTRRKPTGQPWRADWEAFLPREVRARNDAGDSGQLALTVPPNKAKEQRKINRDIDDALKYKAKEMAGKGHANERNWSKVTAKSQNVNLRPGYNHLIGTI